MFKRFTMVLQCLVLGEGRSNFIATLLNLQPEGMKSAYAIDAQVLNAPAGYESQYIPAFFQNLNLIDSETGEQAQFDFYVLTILFLFCSHERKRDQL
jgi:hypothetical protein